MADEPARDANGAAATTAAPSQHEAASALFAKVLDVENPVVTSTLVNLLNEDEPCALFVSYITRLAGSDEAAARGDSLIRDGPAPHAEQQQQGEHADDADDAPPPAERDTVSVTGELRRSFRATMLLTNDDASDALITFLPRKSALLTKCIFPVFQRDARGNLRHACRVIDYLLRMYLDDVYDVVGRDAATVARYMGPMLEFIDHAYVAEAFLTMVCKPHSAALMRYYASSPPKKWAFFRALSDWKLLLVLAEHVHSRRYSEKHNAGAADVFVELLDRLAADDNGGLLLQPAAYCPELLAGLVDAAVDPGRTPGQRTGAMKCVFRLLQKSTTEKVQGPPTSPYQSFGGTIVNLVANQLAPLRERVFALVETHMDKLLRYLVEKYEDQQNIEMDLQSGKPLPDGAVRHTGYVVKVPFTEFRLTLVEALVEIVAHNPRKLGAHFDAGVWRVLVSWFFEYAHNNLYHAAFYQLLFIALRTDNQAALEALVKKQKLVTALVEHYRHGGPGASNRGYILQCCNAIRLQAASQSPDAFLRNFLQSHTTWRAFEPELRAVTSSACVSGLGFTVPQMTRPGMFQKDSWQVLASDEDESGIDHGSEFARSLGFIDDVAWPDDDAADSGGGGGGHAKKKKHKKKKGKKKDAAGNGAVSADEDDAAENADNADGADEQPAAHAASNGSDSDSIDHDMTTASVVQPSPKKAKAKKKKKPKK
ncbi:hypothetical protein PybrP1_007714 [[Pythium] brassicae (nom. inval.)]|nr:hypothetical protein PybrP1_007714 [[Pythium] brassicae (nom. inval.)]